MALAKKIKRLARLLLPTRTLELAAEMRPKKKPTSVNFKTRAAAPTGASFQNNWREFSNSCPLNHSSPSNWREFSNTCPSTNQRKFSKTCPSIIPSQFLCCK
jgi:hypothetical protein